METRRDEKKRDFLRWWIVSCVSKSTMFFFKIWRCMQFFVCCIKIWTTYFSSSLKLPLLVSDQLLTYLLCMYACMYVSVRGLLRIGISWPRHPLCNAPYRLKIAFYCVSRPCHAPLHPWRHACRSRTSRRDRTERMAVTPRNTCTLSLTKTPCTRP